MISCNNTCLLLTGCISPDRRMINLTLRDKDRRYKQYIECIRFYIEKSQFSKIVFCENSNYQITDNLEILAKTYNKKLELLSFVGNHEKASTLGKGYGESEIINYALDNSNLLKTGEGFIKITGRLKIHNLFLFQSLKTNGVNAYFDFSFKDKLVDTRCFFVKKNYYQEKLSNAYDFVNEKNGSTYEKTIFSILKESNYKGIKQIPFPINFEGMSGSLGTEYRRNGLFKLMIKNVASFIKTTKLMIMKKLI